MWKKVALLSLYLMLFILAWRYHEPLLAWLQNERPSPLTVVPVATSMALVPVVPYGVVGGVIGAMYGAWWGGFFSWCGSLAASLIFFELVRRLFPEQGAKWLSRNRGVERFTQLFERNAFVAILFARLIPVIPSVAVNVYAALTNVSRTTYAAASAVGKIPAMLTFALVGEQVFASWSRSLLIVGLYAVFLGMVFVVYRWWQRASQPQKS